MGDAGGTDQLAKKHFGMARVVRRLRALIRSHELALVLLSALIGVAASAAVTVMTKAAMLSHVLVFDLDFDVRLSATDHVAPLAAFSALMVGGLILGLIEAYRLRKGIRSPVDPIEANALRGGRMSLRESVVVSLQTVISNSSGASVGLESGYAQIGAGLGSFLGQKLRLRRGDLRLLVGAGAAAAIGGAFGAPLAGAFYAFELVLGNYSIASAGPVFTGSIVGVLFTRLLAGAPYQIETPPVAALKLANFPVLLGIAIFSVAIGVTAMRLSGVSERFVQATPIPVWARPVLGGAAVAALAVFTPQILGAGHGALGLDVAHDFPLALLAALLLLKLAAALISLATGFRGGLFFASLFMGALIGKIYGLAVAAWLPAIAPDPTVCALAGMATLGVAIVGGPLTMSFIVLENTSDFSVTAGVVAASVVASLLVRATFGYSFSTWRLHLRGENIRSANDIGWIHDLKVGKLMRRDTPPAPDSLAIEEFCARHPLGSAHFVVLLDPAGRYAGLVNLAEAHARARRITGQIGELALQKHVWLVPEMDARSAMALFDQTETDQLAVLDPNTKAPLGVLNEAYLARRYAEQAAAAFHSAFGD